MTPDASDHGPPLLPPLARYVVPATVMLTFVSFWRAAAIVLGDLGSSAYYVGGIAENKIGKAAPWFILGTMLFSYAVRAVYIESCSMFTRGGVYRVVREALGVTAAKFAVSALMFDYVLTGPISAVSAGLYLASLLDQLATQFGLPHLPLPPNLLAAAFAVAVIGYFWRTNTVGIPFSSTRALRIMQLTTVMVAMLVGWCLLTIAMKGAQPVPAPTPANLKLSGEALGWLKGTRLPDVAVIAVLIGLGHSLLAMSGEESLAQVYREVEAPKRRNLLRVGAIIFGYSLLFTALVAFFAVMLIPDDQRQKVQDNLISGIAMVLVGPQWLRLAFQAFVVVVGVLILSSATNTSIIGSNSVLNRVAEDGVLAEWFREPHRRYGTSYRSIAMIAALQIVTVAISWGDVTLLGEAYAFGVAWSFAMKALGTTVLRFTRPEAERWRVPLNIQLGGREIPIGLILVTTLLFLLAAVNLVTKQAATIGGVGFTIVFFGLLTWSQRRAAAARTSDHKPSDRFRLEMRDGLSPAGLHVRPGGIVVGVHDPERLAHLETLLERVDTAQRDLIVVAVKPAGPDGRRHDGDEASGIVGEREARVFTTAVAAAEKAGKPVTLVGIEGNAPYARLLQAAAGLQATQVVVGVTDEPAGDQERQVWKEWRQVRDTAALEVEIIPDDDGAPTRIDLPAT